MNELIFDLVENTNRNIFLTGKAGTGKTTFLNNFVKKSRKNHIVVAPTGIAAINAGGMTIHSMFGLPLHSFVPTMERIDANLAYNISDLKSRLKYRKEKIKLLREVEIIIIDEVSMLRADVLDMMDFALRFIRRNQQRFGGVQMLFIGDLYQLPPVVKEENEYILSQFYSSAFFFDAKVLEGVDLLTIELTEVFRQKDQDFLDLLNAIRDGDIKGIDFDKLNQRYFPDFEPQNKAFIHICSHNRIADEINQKKLNELQTPSYFYKANIYGEFKENMFPNDEILELKVGTQVMFIRNDISQEKKYYNGKLAEISKLTEDKIYVIFEESDVEFEIKKEVWEQKKYTLGEEKQIEEEVIGSFEQFPIRLAWAVTIHKSQGLTFDRLIVDAGQSFTSGQVYVALSRCRTLEGIYLKSKITPSVIFSDQRISHFQDNTNANDKIEEILEAEKYDYSIKKVLKCTDFKWCWVSLEDWHKATQESKKLNQEQVKNLYFTLKNNLENLTEIFNKFEKVLTQKTFKFTQNQEKWKEVEDKAKGGVNFFFQKINEQIFEPLKQHYATTKGEKGLKGYNEILKIWIDDVEDFLKDLQIARLLETPLFDAENDAKISVQIAKIPTHIITYKMFEEGKSVEEIVKERGLAYSTIMGHLAKFASQGVLDLSRLVSDEKIKIFEKIFEENPQENLTDWKNTLPENFEYQEIRLLWNAQQYLKEKNEE
ncbi:MAG: helix-turn-helix domain-containing protein [Flavobacteriaceae bacterium]|nr:helix-turn-helix domain-containing protein [Flavobacteriaceae bacterium]